MYGAVIILFREVLEAALVIGIVLAASRGVAARGTWVVGGVIAGARPLHVLALVVGLAVLREGSEVVLFLYGIAAGGTAVGAMWTGAALGLAAGAAVGALLYFGLLRIPSRHLFSVTGWLIVLLAAGMAGQAGAYLVQAGVLTGIVEPVWDSSRWLAQGSILGEVLHVLAGYADRPSLTQVLFFVATLVVIVSLDRVVNRPTRKAPSVPAASAATLLATIALAAHAPRAEAAHVVYSPLVEEGEIAVELRGHHDFDGDDALDGAQQFKAEFEWAPHARWLTEVLAEFEREPGDDLEMTEIAWENVFQFTEQGRYWADFGLLAEYAHSVEDDGHDALELGLLAQKDVDRHEVRMNLVFERELTGGAETEMEYAWQYRYRLGERFEPGLEMHGGLGDWDHMGAFDDHEQQLGPACFGKLRTGAGAWKYEAALLFSLNEHTPDATLRFLLEYEF